MDDKETRALLVRIADALERLAPPPVPGPDTTAASAFVWHAEGAQLVASYMRLGQHAPGDLVGIRADPAYERAPLDSPELRALRGELLRIGYALREEDVRGLPA